MRILLLILRLVTALYWDAPQPIVEPLCFETTGGVQIGTVYVLNDIASINVTPPAHACWRVTATDAVGQRATWAERRACGQRLWLPWVER